MDKSWKSNSENKMEQYQLNTLFSHLDDEA